MKYISATEAKNKFGVVLNDVQQEPIIVKRQNTEVAVIISVKDYERMRRLNIEKFKNTSNEIRKNAHARGLTPEIQDELLKDI